MCLHLVVAALIGRYPYVTGTSVLGISYKDGVLLASDTLGAPCLRCDLLC